MSEIIRIKSISEVHQFLDIPRPLHPLVSVIPIDDRITNFDYGNNRYVFDFYQINLKLGFHGSMIYGRNSYDFEDGTLTFIKAGQVIQVESQAQPIVGSSGWTLLFHPDLIRRSGLAKEMDAYTFFEYGINEALHLSEKEIASLSEITKKIEEEFNQNIDKHSQDLIVANIEILLKYCKRFYDRQFYTRTNLNQDILEKFNSHLKEYYDSENPINNGVLTVKNCADNFNLSVNYLGDLLKSETGRSAKDHINEFVIERAKNKLLGSRESISQIAYELGFEYPQGFNKLFKSKVGTSPSKYRSLN